MDLKYTWIMAAFATAGTVWAYARGVLGRLSQILVVSVDVGSGFAQQALYAYAWKNLKSSPLAMRRFEGRSTYIRPLARSGLVGTEINGESALFFDGWKPLFVSSSATQAGGSQHNGPGVRVSFIRGTFQIENLLVKAFEFWNNWSHDLNQGSSRYYIVKKFGRNGIASREGTDTQDPSIAKSSDAGITPDLRPLGYSLEDLGEPVTDKPFTRLSYGPEILAFIKEVARWKKSENWFKVRGMSWRLGALLKGLPGNGKSSFVKAIAQENDMPVHVYDLSTMSNREFTSAWEHSLGCTPCVVLWEDMDRIFDSDKNIRVPANGQALTMDCLLNCISGVRPADGILLLVTANDTSKLDTALGVPEPDGKSTRPGRLDRVLEFGSPDESGRRSIATRILSDCPALIEETVLAGANETGAQFEKRCGDIAVREFWKTPVETKESYSAQEIADSWENFKPTVPLSYLVASRNAIKEKNS